MARRANALALSLGLCAAGGENGAGDASPFTPAVAAALPPLGAASRGFMNTIDRVLERLAASSASGSSGDGSGGDAAPAANAAEARGAAAAGSSAEASISTALALLALRRAAGAAAAAAPAAGEEEEGGAGGGGGARSPPPSPPVQRSRPASASSALGGAPLPPVLPAALTSAAEAAAGVDPLVLLHADPTGLVLSSRMTLADVEGRAAATARDQVGSRFLQDKLCGVGAGAGADGGGGAGPSTAAAPGLGAPAPPDWARCPPATEAAAGALLDEVLESGQLVALSRDMFGNYVVQKLLERCCGGGGAAGSDGGGGGEKAAAATAARARRTERASSALRARCRALALDGHGSRVLQVALAALPRDEARLLARRVALGGGRARLLAADRHGSRVLQRALDAGCDELRARVAEELLLPPDVEEEEAAGGGSGGDFYGSESEEEGALSGDNDPAASSSRRPRPPAKAHRPGAVLLATHPFGCRVLQRILALSPPCEEEEEAEASSPAAALREFRALAARARRQVVLAAPRLATDEYANYVLQKLLRRGSSSSTSRASPSPSPSAPPAAAGDEKPAPALLSAAERHAVARGLLGRARELATHVSGSNVLEAVLASCGRGERRALLAELLSPDRDGGGGERGAATAAAKQRTEWSLEGAMAHPYGNYVFQRALLVCDDADQRELLSLAVAAAEPRLRGSPHGRHLLARVGVVAAASSASPAPVAAEAEGAAAVAKEEEHDGTKEDVAPIPAAAVAAAGKAAKTAAAEKAATTTISSAPVSYAAAAAAAAATTHSQARVPLVATARAQQQQC